MELIIVLFIHVLSFCISFLSHSQIFLWPPTFPFTCSSASRCHLPQKGAPRASDRPGLYLSCFTAVAPGPLPLILGIPYLLFNDGFPACCVHCLPLSCFTALFLWNTSYNSFVRILWETNFWSFVCMKNIFILLILNWEFAWVLNSRLEVICLQNFEGIALLDFLGHCWEV